MKRAVFAAGFSLAVAASAQATCVGSGVFSSCYDAQSGNSYTIQRHGNSTYMNGYNSNTGSNWSQTTNDFGSTSQTYGTDSRGNSWTQTCVSGTCF